MIKSITSVNVKGRRVLLRAGFDVPLQKNIHTEEWEVADDSRITDIMPTLNYLIQNRAKVIIIAHLDRPEGWDKAESLFPVALKLGEKIGYKVIKIRDKLSGYPVPHINFLEPDITMRDYSDLSQQLAEGDILFLENLRFYTEEMANSEEFIEKLAAFAEIFVNDAFSVDHRKEASVYGVATRLPSYAGVGLVKEMQALNKIINNPEPPFIVLIGGAKIVDKIGTINNLIKKADYILVGGAVGNTFLKAKGYEIGKSKVNEVNLAQDLLRNHKEKIVLPVDVVVDKALGGRIRAVKVDLVKPTDVIMDIGPETVRKYAEYIKPARTLVWSGPFGLIEKKPFDFGSLSLARIFASRSKGTAFGVVGGGETEEMIRMAKVSEFIDHISSGGGAMLEFLSGKTLPGIKVLER
ncbi:MAG: phosphoglycerate kinase [Candidatus Doudnabacteria bacterium]|nr:phosphoglycerate kinase [Candidatus Doudnabacteria bacterium]